MDMALTKDFLIYSNGIMVLFSFYLFIFWINTQLTNHIYFFCLFAVEANQNQKHCFEKCANFLRNFVGK